MKGRDVPGREYSLSQLICSIDLGRKGILVSFQKILMQSDYDTSAKDSRIFHHSLVTHI